MSYIHVYEGGTAGLTDGNLVSEGDGTQPVNITLNASNNEESSNISLSIRCDTGYVATSGCTITPTGSTASKWKLSSDGITFGAYGAMLTISSAIDATNTKFYAVAKATSDETPQNDTTVDLVVSATIAAV